MGIEDLAVRANSIMTQMRYCIHHDNEQLHAQMDLLELAVCDLEQAGVELETELKELREGEVKKAA